MDYGVNYMHKKDLTVDTVEIKGYSCGSYSVNELHVMSRDLTALGFWGRLNLDLLSVSM